eukprot:162083-Chlamydomonas_euryale.AAC.1
MSRVAIASLQREAPQSVWTSQTSSERLSRSHKFYRHAQCLPASSSTMITWCLKHTFGAGTPSPLPPSSMVG